MSERKHFNTPTTNLNTTSVGKKTSSSKRYSPNVTNRARLNETVCSVFGGSKEHPSIKACISGGAKYQLLETETDLVYNDYLQSLLRYGIVEKEIKNQKEILQGQISLQEKNVNSRKEILQQIQNSRDLFMKQEGIIEKMETLEKYILDIQCIYSDHQTQKSMETVHPHLQRKAKMLTFKNVEPITTQKQLDSLIDSLKQLVCICERIISCGRDFEGVHNLAEDCRNLKQIAKSVRDSQMFLSTIETRAVNAVLQKLTDAFAKQYENIED